MRYTPSTIAPRAIVTPLNVCGARCTERSKEEGNGSAVVGTNSVREEKRVRRGDRASVRVGSGEGENEEESLSRQG